MNENEKQKEIVLAARTCTDVVATETDRSESAAFEWHCPLGPECIGSRKERTMCETDDCSKEKGDIEMKVFEKINRWDGHGRNRAE